MHLPLCQNYLYLKSMPQNKNTRQCINNLLYVTPLCEFVFNLWINPSDVWFLSSTLWTIQTQEVSLKRSISHRTTHILISELGRNVGGICPDSHFSHLPVHLLFYVCVWVALQARKSVLLFMHLCKCKRAVVGCIGVRQCVYIFFMDAVGHADVWRWDTKRGSVGIRCGIILQISAIELHDYEGAAPLLCLGWLCGLAGLGVMWLFSGRKARVDLPTSPPTDTDVNTQPLKPLNTRGQQAPLQQMPQHMKLIFHVNQGWALSATLPNN